MGWSYLEKEKALDKLNIPYENSSTQVCILKLSFMWYAAYSMQRYDMYLRSVKAMNRID